MSEENLGSSFPTIEVDLVDQRLQSLEKMFKSFMETSSEDKKKNLTGYRQNNRTFQQQ